MGYANATIRVTFDELSEDPVIDPIWAVMRNPRMMPPGELKFEDVPVGDDGKPLDADLAETAMYERLSKAIVALRAYDASAVGVDPLTGEIADQPLLTPPITPDLLRKLPMAMIEKLSTVFVEALSPKSDPDPNTSKTSIPSPSASSTEPGLPELSLLSSNTSS